MQHADPQIRLIIDCIKSGHRPSAAQIGASLDGRYLKAWDRFILCNDVLYRKSCVHQQDVKQIILPDVLHEEVFRALHDDLGHQGRDRTAALFRQKFYWPGMEQYVCDKVRTCNRCVLRKAMPTKSAELVNITSSAPLELVCVDYLSLEPSKGGLENILVITDHSTRYSQAIPTRNQTARTTARMLIDSFIVHYGFPATIHTQ